MTAAAETIHQYFRKYGWQYDFDAATSTWITGFQGDARSFSVLVHLTDDWIYFIISPYADKPVDDVCAGRLNHHLLRLNHAMNIAKFSIDSDGDVVLTVELPAQDVDYHQFAESLNALSYYADWYFDDITGLVTDAEFSPTPITEEEEDDRWSPLNMIRDSLDKPN